MQLSMGVVEHALQLAQTQAVSEGITGVRWVRATGAIVGRKGGRLGEPMRACCHHPTQSMGWYSASTVDAWIQQHPERTKIGARVVAWFPEIASKGKGGAR